MLVTLYPNKTRHLDEGILTLDLKKYNYAFIFEWKNTHQNLLDIQLQERCIRKLREIQSELTLLSDDSDVYYRFLKLYTRII